MFYREPTIHNIIDKDGNVIVSIRKAHIKNINESISVEDNEADEEFEKMLDQQYLDAFKNPPTFTYDI
jgi:hypothetical protein